jgi:hypothetical protein
MNGNALAPTQAAAPLISPRAGYQHYFSGINPRGLNRRTSNNTNPMVSKRI